MIAIGVMGITFIQDRWTLIGSLQAFAQIVHRLYLTKHMDLGSC